MITKEKVIDSINIVDNGIILLRETTKIIENGKIISKNYHRYSLCPGDNVDNFDDRIKDISKVIWTDEVIEVYKNNLKKS